MSDNQALTTMKFDSKPLNGLRGMLSIHIVLFHSILFSQAKSNIYGQVSCICYEGGMKEIPPSLSVIVMYSLSSINLVELIRS